MVTSDENLSLVSYFNTKILTCFWKTVLYLEMLYLLYSIFCDDSKYFLLFKIFVFKGMNVVFYILIPFELFLLLQQWFFLVTNLGLSSGGIDAFK